MAEATLHHGEPQFVDHTPGSAVAAGDVVVVDNYTYVAHTDIAASELGAVAAKGGVYKMVADGAISAGDKVYWDASAGKVTVTADASANKHLGRLSPDSSAAGNNSVVVVIHEPDGSAI